MNRLKNVLQGAAEVVARPYVRRELPGWGRVYSVVVGGYRRNWLWEGAGQKTVRGKLHKHLMTLDLAQWPDRSTYFLERWYDLETQLFLSAVTKAGDVVVDVGANRGMFALAASQAVGDAGRVICFEPNPRCATVLRADIRQNDIKNIEVRDMALGQQPARLVLSIPRINSGEATLGPSNYAECDQIDCAVEIGDEQLAGVNPVLIKIDVEGYECQVINGLRKTIERARPMFITEVVADHLERCGTSQEELYKTMQDLGYQGFRMDLRRCGGDLSVHLKPLSATREGFDAVWIPRSDVGRLQHLL